MPSDKRTFIVMIEERGIRITDVEVEAEDEEEAEEMAWDNFTPNDDDWEAQDAEVLKIEEVGGNTKKSTNEDDSPMAKTLRGGESDGQKAN